MKARDLSVGSSEPVFLVKTEGYWRDRWFNEACDHIISYENDMNGWVYLVLMCVNEADRAQTLQSLYVQRCMDLACE